MEDANKNNLKEIRFLDKFAPKSLANLVCCTRVGDCIKNGAVDHSIFYGQSGLGKSNAAKIIMLDYDHLYLNIANEASVKLLREEGDIYNFANQIALDSKSAIKVVVLDELGRKASHDFYEALKGFMDTHTDLRFIAVTNYIGNIPASLLDRFTNKVNFDPQNEEEKEQHFTGLMNRTKVILKAIKIEFTEEDLKTFIAKSFPSFRTPLSQLQILKLNDKKNLSDIFAMGNIASADKIYDLILKGSVLEPEKIYSVIEKDFSTQSAEVINLISDGFVSHIIKKHPDMGYLISKVLISSATHMNMLSNGVRETIVVKSLIFDIMSSKK
jgi:DNA polymerase III delta prime subunit